MRRQDDRRVSDAQAHVFLHECLAIILPLIALFLMLYITFIGR